MLTTLTHVVSAQLTTIAHVNTIRRRNEHERQLLTPHQVSDSIRGRQIATKDLQQRRRIVDVFVIVYGLSANVAYVNKE